MARGLRREVLYASMPDTVLRDGADGLAGPRLGAADDLGLGGLEATVEAAEQDKGQVSAPIPSIGRRHGRVWEPRATGLSVADSAG